jgi:DNA polymerase III subunit delta'
MFNSSQYEMKILGHERIVEVLLRAWKLNRFPHALLFSGPQGVGKRSLALEFSKIILGNTHHNLKRVDDLVHPDLIFVDENWGISKPTKTIKIEAVRKIEERIRIGSFESGSLIVIIDPAHAMTLSAANSLLKTLEEPPEGVYFFIITQSPNRLPVTIRSRCHSFKFSPLKRDILRTILENLVPNDLDNEKMENILTLCEGSVKKGIDFFSSDHFQNLNEILENLFNVVFNGSIGDIFELSEIISSLEQDSIYQLFLFSEFKLKNILTKNDENRNYQRNFDPLSWIKSLNTAKQDLLRNVNKRLLIEHLLWDMRKK